MASMTDIEALRREANAAQQASLAAARAYDRGAWIKLAVHFFVVPFVVVVLRHQLEPWSYYLLGALYVLVGVWLLYLDRRDRAVRDRAAHTAERSKQAYEQALGRRKEAASDA